MSVIIRNRLGDIVPLRARTSEATAALLCRHNLLRELVTALGSPLNIVLPQQITRNIAEFKRVYDKHALSGTIFGAHKANRSTALARQLAATQAGIDVASAGEMRHALGAGFAPERIIATGPKSREFLWLCARIGATVAADSSTELRVLADLVAAHDLPRTKVLLRFADFTGSGTTVLTRRSRFGSAPEELPAMLRVIENAHEALKFAGVSYHIDTVSLAEKATALEGCLRLLRACADAGIPAHAIDVGGGFGVNYLADGAEWDQFVTALTASVTGKGPEITWRGHGYGLRAERGTVRGALALAPAHRPVAGAGYLDALLSAPAPTLAQPLGALLQETLTTLHCEPGRALFDQCGITLARVAEVRGTGPDCLIRVDMNASDVSMEAHGIVMDPVLLPRSPGAAAGSGYLIGNLCLEADFISRRRISFPHMPVSGDLLAFVNTAGYLMDFHANSALHQPIASTVAAYQADGEWQWCHDEQYWPITPLRTAL